MIHARRKFIVSGGLLLGSLDCVISKYNGLFPFKILETFLKCSSFSFIFTTALGQSLERAFTCSLRNYIVKILLFLSYMAICANGIFSSWPFS